MTARDPAFVAALREALRGTVLEDETLGRYTTFRIGGPATVVLPEDPEDAGVAVGLAARAGVPWFALGLGSNVLLPDEGLDALVIRIGRGLDAVRSAGESWWLGAGLPAPLAARRTAAAGYAGLHRMVGVPGTVGGGVFMNAGCHGTEWADVVRRVTAIDAAGHDLVLDRAAIPFRYRRSGLRDLLVVEVEVVLTPAEPDALAGEIRELFSWRQNGTPFNEPCCGSTFTNPVLPPEGHPAGLSTAGQFIEAAGLKGRRMGGIEISPRHANYFVNTGGGTAADVLRLIEVARRAVLDRFGVELTPEVKLVDSAGRYQALPTGASQA